MLGYEEGGDKKINKLKIRRIKRNLWIKDICLLISIVILKSIGSKVLENINFWSRSILEGLSWIAVCPLSEHLHLPIFFMRLWLSGCFLSVSFSDSFFGGSPVRWCFSPRELSSIYCFSPDLLTQVISSNLWVSATMYASVSDRYFSISKLWPLPKDLFSFDHHCCGGIFP